MLPLVDVGVERMNQRGRFYMYVLYVLYFIVNINAKSTTTATTITTITIAIKLKTIP